MIIDLITSMAEHLGVPTDVNCSSTESRAGRILERIETLYLIDYQYDYRPPLGVRFAEVDRRYRRQAVA